MEVGIIQYQVTEILRNKIHVNSWILEFPNLSLMVPLKNSYLRPVYVFVYMFMYVYMDACINVCIHGSMHQCMFALDDVKTILNRSSHRSVRGESHQFFDAMRHNDADKMKKRCSSKFHKIPRKTPVLESLF